MIISKRKLIDLVGSLIVSKVPTYAYCFECGLVFRDKIYLKEHMKVTGHKNFEGSQSERMQWEVNRGVNDIFDNASKMPIYRYYKEQKNEIIDS